MSEFASFESIYRLVTRGLCLVAMAVLGVSSAASSASAADGLRSPQLPRPLLRSVFVPPAAPPATFTLRQAPTPKPKPKASPTPQPKLQPAPVPAPKSIPAPVAKPAPQAAPPAAPPAPGWVPRGGTTPASTVRLYGCVKYKGTDEIPQDAIPLVIQVPDPREIPSLIDSLTPQSIFGCAYPRGSAYPRGCPYPRGYSLPGGCAHPRGCARPQGPRMVNIKICVPRCGLECLRVGRHRLSSRRIRYTSGDFKVDIRLGKDGWIKVKYDS